MASLDGVARRTAIADGAALAVFTVVGVLTHGSSATALARDLLAFLGCWFAAALVLRLYAHPSRTRLLATWLLGITAAVLIRAAIVGHWAGDFYGVALGFTLLFVLAARALMIKSHARRAD
jgi:Protein of unknown function (DUF3054)